MFSPICAGQRTATNPTSRVPCCRSCAVFSVLGSAQPCARHDGKHWQCSAWVAVDAPLVSSRPEAGIARPGPAGLGRDFSAGLPGS